MISSCNIYSEHTSLSTHHKSCWCRQCLLRYSWTCTLQQLLLQITLNKWFIMADLWLMASYHGNWESSRALTQEKEASFLLCTADVCRVWSLSHKSIPCCDCTHKHSQADKLTCFVFFEWGSPLCARLPHQASQQMPCSSQAPPSATCKLHINNEDMKAAAVYTKPFYVCLVSAAICTEAPPHTHQASPCVRVLCLLFPWYCPLIHETSWGVWTLTCGKQPYKSGRHSPLLSAPGLVEHLSGRMDSYSFIWAKKSRLSNLMNKQTLYWGVQSVQVE